MATELKIDFEREELRVMNRIDESRQFPIE